MDLSVFKGIVKKQAFNFPHTCYQDREDIEQELWEKVVKISHHLTEITPSEARKLVKTCITRHATDIVRTNRVRSAVNIKLKDDESSFGTVDVVHKTPSFSDNHIKPTQDSQVFDAELRQIILDWSEHQDNKTKIFIREFINPSEDTLKKWDEISPGYPMSRLGYIPATSFTHFVDVSRAKICQILKELRYYLSVGHGIELYT